MCSKFKLQSSIIIALLMLCCAGVDSQSVNGIISDLENNVPLKSATVYINGTNIGTTSNMEGRFSIKPLSYPCTLVVSSVGYKTGSLFLPEYASSQIHLSLEKEVYDISGVTVKAQNRRADNLKTFRSCFLGDDSWGKKATIANEDAIVFNSGFKEYRVENPHQRYLEILEQSGTVYTWSEDKSAIYYDAWSKLQAKSKGSLIVQLPLLGYEVYVDIIQFSYEKNYDQNQMECKLLAYTYFKETKLATRKDSLKVKRNREAVYYNSSQHFLRSLYAHQLPANGYKLINKIVNPDNDKVTLQEIYLDSCLIKRDDKYYLADCINKKYHILYYFDRNGRPQDYTVKRSSRVKQSMIFFSEDSCLINRDGTQSDHSIVFTPTIASKQFGAMLPNDYKVK